MLAPMSSPPAKRYCIRLFAALAASVSVISIQAEASLEIYPVPPLADIQATGMDEATDIEVSVDGNPLFVYDNDPGTISGDFFNSDNPDSPWPNSNPGIFTAFSFSNQSVTLTIRKPGVNVEDVVIRPLSLGLEADNVSDGNDTFTITLDQPAYFAVEINGDPEYRPLFVFADATDTFNPSDHGSVGYVTKNPDGTFNWPSPVGYDVIVVPGGEVYPRDLSASYISTNSNTSKDNTIFHFEGGAILMGIIDVHSTTNLTLRGRGMIVQQNGRDENTIKPSRTDGLVIDGLIVAARNDRNFTIHPMQTNGVTIRNTKIIAMMRDGIDPNGCQNVLIDNVFIFSDDDCIAIKAGKTVDRYPVNNITMQNSTVWGQSLEVGFESATDYMENITFKNIDVVRTRRKLTTFPVNLTRICSLSIHITDDALARNILFEDIRIERPQGDRLIEMWIDYSYASSTAERGHINGATFRNIQVVDAEYLPSSTINGKDASHIVENVTFDGIYYNGVKLEKPYEMGLYAGSHVNGVTFTSTPGLSQPAEMLLDFSYRGDYAESGELQNWTSSDYWLSDTNSLEPNTPGVGGIDGVIDTKPTNFSSTTFIGETWNFGGADSFIEQSVMLKMGSLDTTTQAARLGLVNEYVNGEQLDVSSIGATLVGVEIKATSLSPTWDMRLLNKPDTATNGTSTSLTPGTALTVGNWYKLNAKWTINASGDINYELSLDDYGTDGTTLAQSGVMAASGTLSNAAVVNDDSLFAAMLGRGKAGVSQMDNFHVRTPDTGQAFLPGDAADLEIMGTGSSTNQGTPILMVGKEFVGSTAGAAGRNALLVMDVSSLSGPVPAALLQISYEAKVGSVPHNVDLWGVGYSTTTGRPSTADFLVDDVDTTNVTPDVVKLADNLVTSADNPGVVLSVDVTQYINNRPAGTNYVFFRLNPDTYSIPGGARYEFGSADSTGSSIPGLLIISGGTTITGDAADSEIDGNNNSQNSGASILQAGKEFVGATYGAAGRNALLVMDVSSLSGNVTLAELNVGYLDAISGPGWNLDLWGVGYSTATSRPSTADFQAGDTDTTNVTGDVVKLTDNLIMPGDPTNVMLTVDVTDYINNRPSGTKYVFFRINPDTSSIAGGNHYQVGSADANDGTAPNLTVY